MTIKYRLENDLFGFGEERATWGMSWGDADGDGDLDLWLGHHGASSTLMINRLDEAEGAFVALDHPLIIGDKHAAVWADFDGDGDRDILQLRGGAKDGAVNKDMSKLGNMLIENLGVDADGLPVLEWPDDGEEETDSQGLYYSSGRGRTPTVLDVDYDGRLDVIIANDAQEIPTFPTAVFLQQADGTFVANPSLLGVEPNGVLLAKPADFNGDGLTDLFLRNLAGSNSIVYGNGTGFEPGAAPLPAALNDPFRPIEDVVVADFNNDGTLDLWLANRSGRGYQTLLLNIDGSFIDVSELAGLHAKGFEARNAAMGDFDNDGDVDVYSVNALWGAQASPDNLINLPNNFWENTGNTAVTIDGVLVQVPVFAILEGPDYAPSDDNGLGWSVTVAEMNGDGVLDLVVANGALGGSTGADNLVRGSYDLFLGEGDPANDWLMLELVGTTSNVHGIGSTVLVTTAAGLTQMRFADNGVHNKTHNDPRLHFGLGDLAAAETVSVEIRWTNGMVQTLRGVAPDQVLTIVEGQGQGGADNIQGTDTSEILGGGNAADTLAGAGGNDTLSGGFQADLLGGGIGDDSLVGEAGDDTHLGQTGADTIEGGNGADRLDGGGGNDILRGGAGNDALAGGLGNDTMTGGVGLDRFSFLEAGTFGRDRITDFIIGTDEIELAPGATASVRQTAGGAELVIGQGSAILLEGLSAAQVGANLDSILV